MEMEGEGLQHHQAGSLDYQAAAGHCHDADYATHARRLIECLSDEVSWVHLKSDERMVNEEVPDISPARPS